MAKKTLVVLTGAGISAESGIKTFRDSDGLWENYQIEDVATPQAFARDPELVLNFYNMRRRDVAAAQPNAAHKGLAELQEYFDVRIITQNIDDLHERAGSRNVLHLHGEIFKMRSVNDSSTTYDIISDIQLGHLAPDGGQYRPHIVWFNEEVPMLPVAAEMVSKADFFAVIGTSLHSAASTCSTSSASARTSSTSRIPSPHRAVASITRTASTPKVRWRTTTSRGCGRPT